MIYGLKDLSAPFIQYEGTLYQCWKESIGLGLCGIYRLESDGWHKVASRYWSKLTYAKNEVYI